MTVRPPSEANGPDGYPLANEAFWEAAANLIHARKEDADNARSFLGTLGSSLRDDEDSEL